MLVSVIIPTYNRPQLLKRAIKSILNQQNVNFEIIVVNDFGDDLNLLLECFNNDPRIKLLSNTRKKGANGARNSGILNSKGDYIAFLDDDDEWLPTKLVKQIDVLQQLDNSWGGAYCGFNFFEYDEWFTQTNLKSGNLFIDLLIGKNECNAGSTLIVKKYIFDEIGLFDEKLQRHQDLEFLVRFFRKYKLVCVKEPLVIINGHTNINASKAEENKLIFLKKIESDINSLPLKDMRYIYAFQFRELSVIFSRQHNLKKTIFYLKSSLKYRFLEPYRYIVIVLNIIGIVLNFDFERYLNKLKRKYLKFNT